MPLRNWNEEYGGAMCGTPARTHTSAQETVRLQREPLRWACWTIDLNEQKARTTADERNRVLREKTRLINLLAHEINNPLSIVTNVLYLLGQKAALDDGERRFIAEGTRALERMSETVAALLAAADDRPIQR